MKDVREQQRGHIKLVLVFRLWEVIAGNWINDKIVHGVFLFVLFLRKKKTDGGWVEQGSIS